MKHFTKVSIYQNDGTTVREVGCILLARDSDGAIREIIAPGPVQGFVLEDDLDSLLDVVDCGE